MKRKRPMGVWVAGGLVIGIAVISLVVVQERVDRDEEGQGTHIMGTEVRRSSNFVEQWRDELDRQALGEGLECVDAEGVITCGKYAGDRGALIYATLIGSSAHVERISSKETLARQGDEAVSAAAALGDLAIVELLIELGRKHDLIQQDQLSEYPLFSAEYAGPHPAADAARFGQLEVLAFFVERGFDVNTKLKEDGITDSFLIALIGRQGNVMQFLLDNGYLIDCKLRFPNGRTYLDVAESLEFAEGAAIIRHQCP